MSDEDLRDTLPPDQVVYAHDPAEEQRALARSLRSKLDDPVARLIASMSDRQLDMVELIREFQASGQESERRMERTVSELRESFQELKGKLDDRVAPLEERLRLVEENLKRIDELEKSLADLKLKYSAK